MTDDDDLEDRDYFYYPAEKFVIAGLFTWLVPRLFIEIASYRQELKLFHRGEQLQEALQVLRWHSLIAIIISLVVISASAAGVGLATRGLNDNMIFILAGLSRVVFSVILFILSIEIPQWLGVYDYVKLLQKYSTTKTPNPDTFSLRELKVSIQWDIYGHVLKIYGVLLIFFCGSRSPSSFPVAISAGILSGLLVVYAVYEGRTKYKQHKHKICYATMLILMISSCLVMATGWSYIQAVWYPHASDARFERLSDSVFCISLLLSLMAHALLQTISRNNN